MLTSTDSRPESIVSTRSNREEKVRGRSRTTRRPHDGEPLCGAPSGSSSGARPTCEECDNVHGGAEAQEAALGLLFLRGSRCRKLCR